MPTVGLGLDLIEIGRLERAIERRPQLAERLFSPDELRYAQRRARPGRHLAGRFAAKEAVIKALGGTDFGAPSVEIVGSAPPEVKLSGRAAELARDRGLKISVSITHSRESAAAVAITEPL